MAVMPPKRKKKSTANGNAIEMTGDMSRSRHKSFSTFSMSSIKDKKEEEIDEDSPGDKEPKSKQFQQAAMSGDEDAVEAFISKGIELSVTDEFGRTPLHNAILGKQLRIVDILLSRGADVQLKDERGDTPLHTAVRTGDERILQVNYLTCNMEADLFQPITPRC
ncbi:hypothetical protein OS493_010736 [Desmophyllum pertusum]|uniref:Uncharacterized protein n=1 Tax=Desmophyllum pertusum TaxID=174260 RepID=A0A9X0D494_9CNID|nr:hypothetical protein OS493_010736 [Desmophyllum pertusum]